MSILVKDKFLFTATTIPAEVDGTLTHSQLTEVMKVRSLETFGEKYSKISLKLVGYSNVLML